MSGHDWLKEEYTVSDIAGRMGLRKPQKESLERLEAICNAIRPSKTADVAESLAKVNALYPTCKDFERAFPSMTFALATGVGKTRLMGAFIAYLYTQHGICNFFVVAPGKTVYEKLKTDLGVPGSAKYVFSGLGCFNSSPQIVADDDYRQRRLALTDSKVRIFIFNIDKFNKEDAKMRQLNEYLGQSFFDELTALDDLVLLMDESHHYRAERGAAALNDLKPILGLELTATPKTNKGGKEKLFSNVVFEYPLSQAIADGYTRTPYAIARKNVDFANLPQEYRDKMMLADGIASHERTKVALEVYAAENNKRIVKPFMLVVCKDTEHAAWIEDYIKSNAFCEGRYANKTITVHSKQTGAESEENMGLLLGVERSDNPIEIVIHVNMLKEGWDVNNLYTIVPLRTAASAVLREQMVGRGLRLPYGERTDDTVVDAVTLTAHDKFDELLAEAQKGESIFKQGCIIKVDENESQEEHVITQPNLSFEAHDPVFDAAVVASGRIADDGANKARRQVEVALAKATALAMAAKKSRTLDVHDRRSVVEQAASEVAQRQDVVKYFAPAEHVFDDWIAKTADRIVVETASKFIPIPKLRVVESGGDEIDFEPFYLDLNAFIQEPTDNSLLLKNLEDLSEESRILDGGKIDFDGYNPMRRLVEILRDKPEIDYSRHGQVVGNLVVHVCNHFSRKFGDNGLRNIVMMNCNALADEIYRQMLRHMVRRCGMFTEAIVGANDFNLPSHYRCKKGKIKDLHDDAYSSSDDGSIKGIVFSGAKKGVFGEFKVDSSPELRFARIVDTDPDVKNWLRPAGAQFDFTYNGGHKYEPDFVVETDSDIYLVEIKRHDMVDDEDVAKKRERAVTYCSRATTWAKANGYKPWTHLFIPDHEVRSDRGFDDFVKLFSIKE